jgi:hypothetical protein
VRRAELPRHYARAIWQSMAKGEDAYECNRSVQLWPKALALLRDPTDKHVQTLHALKPELKTESDVAAISGATNEAETANKRRSRWIEMNLLPVSCSF